VNGAADLWLSVVLPLAVAILVTLCGRWPNIRETVTVLGAGALCAHIWSLPVPGSSLSALGEPAHWEAFKLFPGLTFAFELDALGLLFARVSSTLWLVTSVYAIGYMRSHGEKHQTRFYSAFALAMAATMGVAMADNLFTLFVCYEILTLSTYPLVTHHGTEEARKAGRVYLGMLLGTSIGLLFVAMIATWTLAGTLDFTPGGVLAHSTSDSVLLLLLLLFLFGTGKAALMPVHHWLPAAMVAPTPVSALLHAVAVVKAGVFTVLKIFSFIVGPDFFHGTAANVPVIVGWFQQGGLVYLAVVTLLLASVQALRQDNLKRRLAYSTISQLAYIVLAGLMANSLSLVGGAMHIATHAFGKIVLFFAAGAILITSHKTRVSELQGLGRKMPITFACFFLASLSVIGLPPFGGFWSKWYLAHGAVAGGQWLALIALMLSTMLTIAYLLPVALRGFYSVGSQSETQRYSLRHEAPWPCLLAMVFGVCGCVYLFFQPHGVYELAAVFSADAVGESTIVTVAEQPVSGELEP
jgi:multicomponent Na+:H+ antiporter subunit D